MPKRIIGHLDMDAFFAAIEERNNPHFSGQPIVVGADPRSGQGRGVVSTANYRARRFGIHSAMPIRTAWHLAQGAVSRGEAPVIFLPGSFRAYSQVSQAIMAIIKKYAPHMQQCSVDEAYFDLSFTGSTTQAKQLCQGLKDEIKAQEKITASIGIGPNKLIAKIAAGFQKPDGLTAVAAGKAAIFLAPLPIQTIPGIGPKTAAVLHHKGIVSINDMRRLSRTQLDNLFGKWGLMLYEKIRGHDTSPLHDHEPAKSISEQTTFPVDTHSPRTIIEAIMTICQHLIDRLAYEGFSQFRTVTITIRFADFQTISHARTTPTPFTSRQTLIHEALRLLLPFLDRRKNAHGQKIRLVGVRLTKIK